MLIYGTTGALDNNNFRCEHTLQEPNSVIFVQPESSNFGYIYAPHARYPYFEKTAPHIRSLAVLNLSK